MADQAKLRKRLEELLKRPENQTCIDCKSRGPRWASANLGIFFCLNCSGIHRKLGVHISFVRSVNLDSWTVQQVENMERWGNKRGAAYFEAEVPAGYHVPREGASVREMERWIRDKYEYKRFVPRDGSIPAQDSEESKTDVASSTSDEAEERPARRTRSPRPASTRSTPRATPTPTPTAVKPATPVAPAAPSPQPQPELDLLDFSEPEVVPPSAVVPVAAGAVAGATPAAAGVTNTVAYSQFGFFSESVSTTVTTPASGAAPPGFPGAGAAHVVTPTPEAQPADTKPKMSNDMIMSMFNPAPMQMPSHMGAMPNGGMGMMGMGMGAGMAPAMGMGMGMGFGSPTYATPASTGMGMPAMTTMPTAASAPSASPMAMPMGGMNMGMNMNGMGGMMMGGGMGMAPAGGMPMNGGGYPAAGQMGGFGGMGMGGMGMGASMGMPAATATSPTPMSSPMVPHVGAGGQQQSPMGMMGMQGYAAAAQMSMPAGSPMQMTSTHSAYAAQYAGWTHTGMAAPSQPQRMA